MHLLRSNTSLFVVESEQLGGLAAMLMHTRRLPRRGPQRVTRDLLDSLLSQQDERRVGEDKYDGRLISLTGRHTFCSSSACHYREIRYDGLVVGVGKKCKA